MKAQHTDFEGVTATMDFIRRTVPTITTPVI